MRFQCYFFINAKYWSTWFVVFKKLLASRSLIQHQVSCLRILIPNGSLHFNRDLSESRFSIANYVANIHHMHASGETMHTNVGFRVFEMLFACLKLGSGLLLLLQHILKTSLDLDICRAVLKLFDFHIFD